MLKQLQQDIKALRDQLQVVKEFDDLISEEDAAKKFGCTLSVLQNMRRKGTLRKWYSLNSRNIMVSKSELLNLLKNPA